MRLVLFDIDGTLISQPGSERLFFNFLVRKGVLGPRQWIAGTMFAIANLLRFGRHTLRKDKAYLSGLRVATVAALADEFVKNELAQHLVPVTVQRLHGHLTAGDRVILLSGTPQFIADPLARLLGADAAVAAMCAVDGDRFAARAPLRHPLGESKADAAREIARQYGLPLESAVAYGDSINDVALFRVVGHSVAISPGRRLRKLATGNGWEILPC